ncbi:hemagglutinin repeat-containing protein, partial [Escherichia coli]|nr:hemagglutinin repeat-containing protein [Escherichia coli]EHY1766078.1 hemagglutinin repeat-containing protein [Escherichia coli]EHY1786418.1 hemagglutinin repeat-containing protein [Escherichia coli]EIA7637517.1 hemagglutinin repeat-containing protein [Escherichia coli]
LALIAGHDVTLTGAQNTSSLDEYHKVTGSSGMLSKTTTTTHDITDRRTMTGSELNGDTVSISAGHNLNVTGSSVAGDNRVSLAAGNNLSIGTLTESNRETHLKQEKKSGLMSSGGVGFSVGSQSLKVTDTATDTTQKGSTVGSVHGDVSLQAGNRLTVNSSDLIAGRDMALSGKEVSITAATDQHVQTHTVEQKTSGLTLALSGTAGSALNTTVETVQAAKSAGNSRLEALQGVKAALSGAQAVQAGRLADAQGADAGNNNTVGISLSYGSQSSKSEQQSEQTVAKGSTLTAGNHLSIQATGSGVKGVDGDLTIQGSQIKAGNNVLLQANRDVNLVSAENTSKLEGKNTSGGGSVGVGIGVGAGGWGISVSASANQGKGSEKGNGTTHTETTVDAGNRLTIISGRDTTLTGAQAGGETVKVDAGRHLTLTSEQDSDRYDSKQQNASAGGSFTFGSMSGSASVNLSRDKMHSNYDSVQEQTGIFAGRGGFDVTTGQHTQLNGAVIASTATADKNRLDTGTLGFRDIENRADYKVEHQSVGISTGGSIGGQFAGNMANNLLVGANHEGHAESTTQSAVSAGNITIRDTQSQKQDVADLNRDAAHANQTLSPIFDREKEQQRLQMAQLIGEIGNQVADIARTEGQIAGEKAKRDPAILNQAREELEAAGKPFTEQDVAQRAYNNGMAASGFGTGGKYQQAIQAATAAVQGLAGGNLSAALAGGAAPYIAEIIKNNTPDGAGRVAAHAVVNAALAVAQGNNALAGAAGAATGEVVGMIATQMYGKPVNELSETEKQTVSTLATVAAGLAGGLVGNSGASAVAGAQSGKTTVENNALSLPSGMVSYGQAVASWNQYADANNLTPEQKQAGLDKLAKGELPEGANISKVIVDGYKDGVLIAGAWYLGPAASVGKVIGGGVIAEIANGTYQWFDLSQPGNENKNWDWKSSASAGITGMLAPGRTVGQNVGIAMGSAFFTDGPNAGAIGGAAAGAWAGGLFGEYAPGIVNSVTGKEIPGFVYDYWGGVASEFSSGFIKDLNKPKGSSEDKKK